ncbi:MAG TPA: MATE family efflux transporter, partial [Polyangia bacterium]|nr:MATE family efflux transporter [Polyangia bacterium]
MTRHNAPLPTLRTLLALAWPIVISRSTQVVIGLTDALLVADLGESALAAATTGGLNVFALAILPMGVVFIVSSFSSQLFGKGDLDGARRYGFYGLAVAVIAGVLSIAGIGGVPTVLSWLPYTSEVRQLVAGYLAYRLLSVGAIVGMEALANYYGGLGNTRLPMMANVAAMVLNVFGNWVLIRGHLGAPAMGVKGAALASTLATSICFLALLGKFLHEGRATGRTFPRLHARELWRMLRFGVPSGFN